MKFTKMTTLSPAAEKLLNNLIQDFSSKMPENERVLNVENASAYIYNLFTERKYDFSFQNFADILAFLNNSAKKESSSEKKKEPREITPGLYMTKLQTKDTFRVTSVRKYMTNKKERTDIKGIWGSSPHLGDCPIDEERLAERLSD